MYDALSFDQQWKRHLVGSWPTYREMELLKRPLRPYVDALIAVREEDLNDAIVELNRRHVHDIYFIVELLLDSIMSNSERRGRRAVTILSRFNWLAVCLIITRLGRSQGGPGAIRLVEALPQLFPSLDDLELVSLHSHLMGFLHKKDRPALANACFEIWVQLEKFLLQEQRDVAMRLVAIRLMTSALRVTNDNLAEARQLIANTGSRIVSAICSGSEAPPTPRYRKGEQ